MEKFLKLLPWLDSEQAVSLLQSLTGAPVTTETLRQICAVGHLPAYVDCSGIKGEEYEGSCRTVCGDGIQRIERPERMTINEKNGLLWATRPVVSGPGWLYPSKEEMPCYQESIWWNVGDMWSSGLPAIIKPSDIQLLVDKMRGEPTQEEIHELSKLREQSAADRQSRDVALRRFEQAESKVLQINNELKLCRSNMEDARLRAKQAEESALAYKSYWENSLANESQVRQQLDMMIESRTESERRADLAESVNKNLLLAVKLSDFAKSDEVKQLHVAIKDITSDLEHEKAMREAAEKRAELAEADAKNSHLLAIAALLELLKAPVEHTRPQGRNQEAIKDEILRKFPWRGLSDRNLQTIFAEANKAKADAK